jgi:RNA polymerase-interacting CarD/CdnL/TRCF family regulator
LVTTVQITEVLQQELKMRKLYQNETYEDVIWDLIEDTKELDEETKAEIAQAREEIKEGKVRTLSEVKKELGL